MPHRRRPRIRLFYCRSQLATCPFYISIELGVGSLIHLAHAPLADEGGHVVMGESGADVECHELLLADRANSSQVGKAGLPAAQNSAEQAYKRLLLGFSSLGCGQDR